MDNSVPLTEKYRPSVLSDLIYQEDSKTVTIFLSK